MGMTIDLALDIFKHPTDYFPSEKEDADKFAINTMQKYQKIEQILNRLKVRMKDRDEDNGGEPLNAVDRGYHLAYEHLCEEIDNLLKENEDGKID